MGRQGAQNDNCHHSRTGQKLALKWTKADLHNYYVPYPNGDEWIALGYYPTGEGVLTRKMYESHLSPFG